VIAQYTLGVMFAEDKGVPENYIEAYKWLSLLRPQGEWDEQRMKSLDLLESRMTPAQIAEAQRLAAEWWEARQEN
jgi:TPR repeat protein